MRFLIIGLGSMGKRRIRCLQRLGQMDIVGFDPREDRRQEAVDKYGITSEGDMEKAIKAEFDAWIISTPPDTHLDYGFMAIENGIPFFTEANVSDPRGSSMAALVRDTGILGAPSSTMRYYFGPKKIKALLSKNVIGKPLLFTYHTGQYLPDWHPWESYKDFYVSKRETGACREIVPFELSWLAEVFGKVTTLSALKDKVSDLDCDIDDVYQLLLRFENGLSGHLLVDVVSRPAVRVFRIAGSLGTIEWDHTANQVRLWTMGAEPNAYELETFDLGAGTVEAGYIHAEEPYVEEMADFIAAVNGERAWPYSFEDDEAVLDQLIRAENSSDNGVHQ